MTAGSDGPAVSVWTGVQLFSCCKTNATQLKRMNTTHSIKPPQHCTLYPFRSGHAADILEL